jgi:hypothetical protein
MLWQMILKQQANNNFFGRVFFFKFEEGILSLLPCEVLYHHNKFCINMQRCGNAQHTNALFFIYNHVLSQMNPRTHARTHEIKKLERQCMCLEVLRDM